MAPPKSPLYFCLGSSRIFVSEDGTGVGGFSWESIPTEPEGQEPQRERTAGERTWDPHGDQRLDHLRWDIWLGLQVRCEPIHLEVLSFDPHSVTFI